MPIGSPTFRPVADAAVPSMDALRREAPRTDPWDDEQETSDDDRLQGWQGLALFGGLLAVEAGLLVVLNANTARSTDGVVFVALGMLLAIVGVLVTPSFGGPYVVGALGSGAVAVGLGVLLLTGRTFGLSTGRFAELAVLGLVVVGLGLLALGATESAVLRRRLDAEPE